jgi:2-polyprenyl-3-methyl-5-hydroxy-6-metoxy-1,4-benzoquinol methylase
MTPLLTRRDPDLVERMDLPDCDPDRLNNTYRQFAHVNRFISRWGAIYHRHIRPLLTREHHLRLLDVGCGGADIVRGLHARAARDGLALDITAIDPDPRSLAFARAHCPPDITLLQTDTTALLEQGERFDIVTSNHVLHHLEADAVPRFLDEVSALATRRAICSDIERSPLGLALFATATAPFFRDSFIRTDGCTSIRRSFRRGELAQLAPPGWKVVRQKPFRLLALFEHAPLADEAPGASGAPAPAR